jgi:hypothetical protein
MVWFDFFVVWGERDRVEGPFFDVFVGWDIVPTLEFFVGMSWDPVATEDATLVAIDTAVAWTLAFFAVVIDFGLELFLTFF